MYSNTDVHMYERDYVFGFFYSGIKFYSFIFDLNW